jgi:hypothetical protein
LLLERRREGASCSPDPSTWTVKTSEDTSRPDSPLTLQLPVNLTLLLHPVENVLQQVLKLTLSSLIRGAAYAGEVSAHQ